MDDLELIPRTVRDKLDRIGVKLHLRDWQQFTLAERRELHDLPCATGADASFRARLAEILRLRTGGDLEPLRRTAEATPGGKEPDR